MSGDRDRDDRPELDVDSAFAALVAQFSAPAAEGHPWPSIEDDGDDLPEVRSSGAPDDGGTADGERAQPRAGEAGEQPSAPPRAAGEGRTGALPPTYSLGPSGPVTPPELDEHYEPPEPPPFPRGDAVSRFAWAGVIGGPLFLLIAAMLSAELPQVLLLVALGAFIGGFVTLVARMPGEAPEDDDGAVV